MPNWCNNSVTIRHADSAKLAALADAINDGNFCKTVKPIPEALNITASPGTTDTELRAAYDKNTDEYGYATWYDFCTNEWGTKWDIEPYEPVKVDGDEISFGFDSAWAPPIGIYEELMEQGFKVEATYYEPGMCFVGRWTDGDDEYFEYSNIEDPDELREFIGDELDDGYGISESMREYMEDEE